MPKTAAPDPLAGRITTIRSQRVVLDADLARLYCVSTKVFNQAIKRNAARFPKDFAFQLTMEEYAVLRSQIVTSSGSATGESERNWSQIVTSSKATRRGKAYRPWAFTEHGAVMAANVLRSERAVAMSVYVVRAFVQMREELMTSAVILKRLAEVDKKLVTHDVILRDIYEKLRPLLTPSREKAAKEMGFHTTLRKP
jgi:phage regulator Rha-like protein